MAVDVSTRTAIDDIFDDNFSDFDDDPFADKPTSIPTRDDKAVLSPRSSLKRKADDRNDKENMGLGLDEEVKIVKKRQPIAKLDEARLLSETGLPVLRKLIREKHITRKLRLKGKGHELTDAARLLNYYQLWLDNLYPRAKFADALQLVEKAGHTKRMQMMRSEWINEGKPGYLRPEPTSIDVEITPDEMPDLFEDSHNVNTNEEDQNSSTDLTRHQSLFGNGLEDDSLFIPDGNKPDQGHNDSNENEPDDDELDALLAMQDDYRLPEQPTKPPADAEDSEGEDDLDALLAEQDARKNQNIPSDIPFTLNSDANYHDIVPDLDVDDLDALLASQESRHSPSKQQSKDDSQHSIPADLDDEDATDALAAPLAAAALSSSTGDETEGVTTKENTSTSSSHRTDINVVAEDEDSQLQELDADLPSSIPDPPET